jgi:hypothetical protein
MDFLRFMGFERRLRADGDAASTLKDAETRALGTTLPVAETLTPILFLWCARPCTSHLTSVLELGTGDAGEGIAEGRSAPVPCGLAHDGSMRQE